MGICRIDRIPNAKTRPLVWCEEGGGGGKNDKSVLQWLGQIERMKNY